MSKQKFNFKRDFKNYDYKNDLFETTDYGRKSSNTRRTTKRKDGNNDELKYAKWQ